MIYAFLLLIIGSLIALFNWRAGIFAVVLVGFLQDPVRKLVPGEPVYLSLLAAAIFGVCFLSALISGEDLSLRELFRFHSALTLPLLLFLAWLGFSMILAFINTQNILLVGIGGLAYLSPLPALLLGYRFARTPADVSRLLAFYCVVAGLFAVSIYFEKSGAEDFVDLAFRGENRLDSLLQKDEQSKLLGSVGDGFVFYPESGGITVLRSGLFRSPEVAGWHCAAALCFVVILCVSRPLNWKTIAFSLVLVGVVLPALVLTGRRKFLVEIAMFLVFTFALTSWMSSGSGRLAIVYAVAGLITGMMYYYITSSELPGEWSAYIDRSATASGDSYERLQKMTVGMFEHVVNRNGFFGMGAGTGSQGGQHFGGGAVLVGSAAEGGLGKILAELGVPGLLLLCLLGFALGKYIVVVCRSVRTDREVATVSFAITGFLAANAIVFTTAHQIFGDVTVLVILGLLLGMLLRAPYWIGLDISRRSVSPHSPKVRLGRRFAIREA